jgi:hypothetical protein
MPEVKGRLLNVIRSNPDPSMVMVLSINLPDIPNTIDW